MKQKTQNIAKKYEKSDQKCSLHVDVHLCMSCQIRYVDHEIIRLPLCFSTTSHYESHAISCDTTGFLPLAPYLWRHVHASTGDRQAAGHSDWQPRDHRGCKPCEAGAISGVLLYQHSANRPSLKPHDPFQSHTILIPCMEPNSGNQSAS